MSDKKSKKSDLADKFVIRMPDGLRGRIAVKAFENQRAMNAEIVATLEKAYPEIPGLQEFQNDIDFILHTFKSNDLRGWTRAELRQLISTVAYQVGHERIGDAPHQDPWDFGYKGGPEEGDPSAGED